MTKIGWREKIDLPEWGIKNLDAKIDTGAKTSSIHVENITHPKEGMVSFDVILHRKKTDQRVSVTCPIKRETIIKSSNGQKRERIVVETLVSLGGISKQIEITITCRKRMLRRMLIGRTALEGDFLVDVSQRHLGGSN